MYIGEQKQLLKGGKVTKSNNKKKGVIINIFFTLGYRKVFSSYFM